MHDYGESAKIFLPAVNFVSLGSFISVEHAQSELQIYSVASMLVTNLQVNLASGRTGFACCFDRGLENGDWELTDLKSIPSDTIDSRGRKIR